MIVVITSQCIHVLNHHTVHIKKITEMWDSGLTLGQKENFSGKTGEMWSKPEV